VFFSPEKCFTDISRDLNKVFEKSVSALKSVLSTFHAIWTNFWKKGFSDFKVLPWLECFSARTVFSRLFTRFCGHLWSFGVFSVITFVVISVHFCGHQWSFLLSSVVTFVVISVHFCDHQWSCLWSSVVFCSIFCGYFCGHQWLFLPKTTTSTTKTEKII